MTINPTINDIMTRTSVRTYTDQPIEPDKINTILHAAMAAPSACNKQPWRFVVIDDKDALANISRDFPTMHMAKTAPAAILLCGDLNSTIEGEGVDYWIEDVSAAAENLLIAAHALGLGAVWCGIYPLHDRIDHISEMFKLPGHIIPMALICLGYPASTPAPKNKWHPDFIHHNVW